jgi:peroxidase
MAESDEINRPQRGRDHSIQPWLSYRQWCGLPATDDWNSPPADVSPDKWNTLKQLYIKVSDIDLFPGGLAEAPVTGGTVGATFACIIGYQEWIMSISILAAIFRMGGHKFPRE